MNRRALILGELGLDPLWVRRSLLASLSPVTEAAHEAVAAPATTATEVPGLEANARHPLPQVARQANRQLAPLLERDTPVRLEATKDQEVPLADDPRPATIAALDWSALQTMVSECTACGLCQSRQQTVFGVGAPQAELVVVGEAPGEEEDRRGEPFVGRAGQLLDNMLAAIGQQRGERVYIANVLKCRPPGNRNPQAEEIQRCAPYLQRQLTLIAPRVILASGRFAAQTLLGSDAPLSALRGKVHRWRDIPVVVTYHPAYLLRNLPDKSRAWDDLLLLRSLLDSPA